MGKNNSEELAVGEDSFLDTVANLVGILIILVVIVGGRSFSDAKADAQEELKSQLEQVVAPVQKTQRLEEDIEKQRMQLEQYERELAFRDQARLDILDRVTMAKQIVEEQSSELDEGQKQDVAVQQELSELQQQLSSLLNQQGEIPSNEPNAIVLQHLPTPMAKTVFGKEIHVMLKDGMVSVIPWDQLIDALKQEARHTVERNSQKQNVVNQLGPIDGFMMRYGLVSKSGLVSNGSVATMAKLVELDRFELETTPDVIRETVERSLGIGGRLRTELASAASKQATVTVWVYPESFKEFRRLKEMLFVDGYLCAARPLPENMRIGASPRGSSSVAQ